LNNFLGSVFTIENISNIPEVKNRVLDDSIDVLTDIDITPETVASRIKGLNSNMAAGGGGGGGVVIFIFKGGGRANCQTISYYF